MFEIRDHGDPLETLSLVDLAAQSTVTLAPARGGMVTRWQLQGRDVFYLDESTLHDRSKNVRGGNPILFPSPGKLVNDRYARAGKSGTLAQHGFARNLPWSEIERSTQGAAAVVLQLESSEQTRAVFDWAFRLEYRYLLRGRVLRIEQRVINTGEHTLPFGLGFHPYFRVPQADKARTRIHTRATRAYDAVRKQELPLELELTAPELDLRLADHGADPCRLETPAGSVTLSASPQLDHWVLWTLEGKDFVCVEPWSCAADGLNTGQGLLHAEPGEERNFWLEIAVDAVGDKT